MTICELIQMLLGGKLAGRRGYYDTARIFYLTRETKLQNYTQEYERPILRIQHLKKTVTTVCLSRHMQSI
jgi:hypothetical protein